MANTFVTYIYDIDGKLMPFPEVGSKIRLSTRIHFFAPGIYLRLSLLLRIADPDSKFRLVGPQS